MVQDDNRGMSNDIQVVRGYDCINKYRMTTPSTFRGYIFKDFQRELSLLNHHYRQFFFIDQSFEGSMFSWAIEASYIPRYDFD